MSRRRFLSNALAPPPEPTKHDTGLRFTDILFGFVAKEVFVRLAEWEKLSGFVRLHLVVAAIVVLGSWVGYRRSANRPGYEVKFLNLPLARLLLDQLMIILYFRLAVLTPAPGEEARPGEAMQAGDLVHHTALILVLVFVLYAAWDLLGIRMAYVKGGKWYPKIIDGKMSKTVMIKDWPAFWITFICLAVLALLLCVAGSDTDSPRAAQVFFVCLAVVLVGYRAAKEIKGTWQVQNAKAAATAASE